MIFFLNGINRIAFIFSFGYLCVINLNAMYTNYLNRSIDVSGSLMVTTQKITSLAFAFYDGSKSETELSEDQKSQSIKFV